ncbi:hypothetical protein DFJ73DRAFT_867302 [Zopfochytrium polystomum]|nr:hypothetical protein DFJ73DRAFT_867302 [Zopfochytrium polystomum]
MALSEVPVELLRHILLVASSYELGRTYYLLATVCHDFNRILSDRRAKDRILRARKDTLLAFLQTSCAGAPDLEQVMIDYVRNTADPSEIDRILKGYERLRHNSFLNFAVYHGFLDLTRLLISMGASINPHGSKDSGHVSALWGAVEKDNIPILQLLVEAGGECPYDGYVTPFSMARSRAANHLLLKSSTVEGPDDVFQMGCSGLDPSTVQLAFALGANATLLNFKEMIVDEIRLGESLENRERMPDLLACVQAFIDVGLDVEEMLSAIDELRCGMKDDARFLEELVTEGLEEVGSYLQGARDGAVRQLMRQ